MCLKRKLEKKIFTEIYDYMHKNSKGQKDDTKKAKQNIVIMM
jgi:hypothetical protein